MSDGIPSFSDVTEATPFTILEALDMKLCEEDELVKSRIFGPMNGMGASERTNLEQNSRLAYGKRHPLPKKRETSFCQKLAKKLIKS